MLRLSGVAVDWTFTSGGVDERANLLRKFKKILWLVSCNCEIILSVNFP